MTIEKYTEKDQEESQQAEQHPVEVQQTNEDGREKHRAFSSRLSDPSKPATVLLYIDDGNGKIIELCIRTKEPIDGKQTAKLVSQLTKSNPDGKLPSLPHDGKEDPDKKPC